MADIYQKMTKDKNVEFVLRILTVLLLMYFFLIGIKTLSGGMKLLGGDFAKTLFNLTSNPVLALMAGMLATVLFQSSSVTTSIIVGLVSAGTLSVAGAVPMIMGANLGTSVTNTIVSLGFIKNKTNFKRAFAAATVHDFFNILTVVILLPLEIMTGFIEKTAVGMAGFLYGTSMGLKFTSPIKMAIKPVVGYIKATLAQVVGTEYLSAAMLIFAGIVIVGTLAMIVKTMTKVVAAQEGRLMDTIFAKNAYATMLFGVFLTIAVQSSSITTSILVPLAGSGMLTLQSIFPVTVGANIGTTATALLAAMTGNIAGLSIALVHLLFNLLGALMFFAHPSMRQIPIWCAEKLSQSIEKTNLIGLGYVGTVFFAIPVSIIYITS